MTPEMKDALVRCQRQLEQVLLEAQRHLTSLQENTAQYTGRVGIPEYDAERLASLAALIASLLGKHNAIVHLQEAIDLPDLTARLRKD